MSTPFEALQLAPPLLRVLRELNYLTTTPVQAQAIPLLLQGRDLLGCAQTGTGKTASFALPVLHAFLQRPQTTAARHVRALVLTPTRELAAQVGKSFQTYGKYVPFRHALVYGGVGIRPQMATLKAGVEVLVATPGRLLDLINQGCVDLSRVEFFVLDEVDRMLDMGFLPDVRRIVSRLPAARQSLFFSATLAPEIVRLAEGILRNPARVSIAPEATTAERIEQQVCFLQKEHKRNLLERLLREQAGGAGPQRTLVFSRTKHGASKLARNLSAAGFAADAIHGNKSQAQREKTLERFRKGLLPVLVATDVAARGVDVKDIGLVVNFDLPNEPESYVHRIGRTARAGAEGRAVAFCSHDELEYLRDIEKTIRMAVPVWDDHDFHQAGLAAEHAQGPRGQRVHHGVATVAGKRTGPPRRRSGRRRPIWGR